MNILTQSRTNESGFPQFPRHGSSGKKSNRHWRKINLITYPVNISLTTRGEFPILLESERQIFYHDHLKHS